MNKWWLGIFFGVLSTVFVMDLIVHQGRPSTYDGPTHLTTIVEVAEGLKDGQFPVVWADDFAKFGLPIPMLAQQTTSYLGAVFYILIGNVTMSYALVVWVGAFSSLWVGYLLLHKWVNPIASVTGVTVLHFAPYRIANVYARGALPEFFFTTFILLALLGIWEYFHQGKWRGWWICIAGITGMALTHPMMMVPTAFLLVPFTFWCWWQSQLSWEGKVRAIIELVIAAVISIGLAAYYLFPLLLEIKYFYYGIGTAHLNTDHFMPALQYLANQWQFFEVNAVNPRQVYYGIGHLENLLVLMAVAATLLLRKLFSIRQYQLLVGGVFIFGVVWFMTLSPSLPLYSLPLLESIQHPWRFLAIMILFPPLFAGLILDVLPARLMVLASFFLMVSVLCFRLPQLYGKNYLVIAEQSYNHMYRNLHGTYLNTIWSGQIEDYPDKTTQIAVVEGQGAVHDLQVRNSQRIFKISAQTEVRIVDYTFYFPGWKVTSEGREVPIEFQDPNYRGIVTFKLPPGEHQIVSRLYDTKVRLLGKLITLASGIIVLLVAMGQFVQKKRVQRVMVDARE